MADKKLEDAVDDRMYVNVPIKERELLKKKDNFTSTGMDYAGRRAMDEDMDAEWKRNLGNIRGKMEARGYAKGGMVKAGSPKVSAPCKDSKTLKCY